MVVSDALTAVPEDVAGQVVLIAAEIQALHRGRGIGAPDLYQRLGRYLRELAGGDPAACRDNLSRQLSACAAQLAGDMRAAVTASLALAGPPAEMPFLRERVAWLAGQIDRDARTALRRIEAAEKLLAETILGRLRQRRDEAAAPGGWYLRELRTLLRMDGAAPEAREIRRIVSTQAGLQEVKAWLDVPGSPGRSGPDLTAEIVSGGRLVRREHPSGSRFQFVIRLPKPLDVGAEHEYVLVTRMREGTAMRPHYLVVPECRCDAFRLRACFPPGRTPEWVRRVDGETVRRFEEAEPTGELVEPDASGEVRAEFRDLTMYLGYGIQWRLAPA